MKKGTGCVVLALLAALGAVRATCEQGAALSGVVTGPDGARLPQVAVRIELAGRTVQVVTGALGAYRAGSLPPGRCTVRAELPGFAETVRHDVALAAGETTALDLELRLAALSETATVIGGAPRDSLEAAAIRESPARDVGEALAGTPGLWKLRKGGIANDVVLRGLQSRDLSVLIDGQRVYGACPNHMDPPAFHVDFSEVDRIEVAKGPFDVKNQGSLGGTVNVVTRRPESGWRFSPSLALGSYGFWNPAASVAYGGRRLQALAGYAYRASEPYRDGSGRTFTERASYKPTSVDRRAFDASTAWARVGFAPAPGQLLEAAYTRQDSGEVLYPYLLMDGITDTADRINLRFEAPRLGGGRAGVLAQAYFTKVDHWMTDEERVTSTGSARGYSMGTAARTRTWGGRLEGRLGTAAAGVEAYRRTWDGTTEMAAAMYAPQASLPGVEVDVVGAYAEIVRTAGRFTLTGGARLDHARSEADADRANPALYLAYHGTRDLARTDTLPSGKLRVEFRPAPGIEVTAGLGHTARVPEANERFFSLRRMGMDWVGNPALDPPRNTGIEASASLSRSRLTLRGTAFLDRVDGFVTVAERARQQMVSGVMNAKARTWVNVDARLRGGELAASLALADRLRAGADLSYVRGTQDPDPGRGVLSGDLPEMPPLRAAGRLRYDDGRLFASLEGVFVAAQDHVAAELREQPRGSYAVANLAAGLRRGRLSATLGVANLFDRTYAEHLSYQRDPFRTGVLVNEPGRNVFANVAGRF